MKRKFYKSGVHLPAGINFSRGGIAKAILSFVLMLTAMTASANWYYNLQFDNSTYGWSKSGGDKEYKSITTFNCPSGAPSWNGKSSDIKISFAGEFEDGHITYARNTTIRITAPDGYRIEQVILDEPDRIGALSSKNYGNYSYSCTEGTGNYQKMTIYSKDAGLKEISFTTNDNRRQFHSRCIKVWIVKEVESWLNFPASYRVAPGKSTSIAKLNDYSGGNGDSYTASTSDAKIATYDAGSNQLNGVNRGTANITVNYAGNDIYATGSKTFLAEVGNTNNLTIPNTDRYDVTVTRNGQTIAPGTPVFDLEQLTYRFTAKNGYTLLTPNVVTRNAWEGFPTPAALKQENGAYLISNTEDWTSFCIGGVTGNYRMTADVTTARNVANQNTFNGTFDGGGHTLTVNYNTNSIANLAPFCNISDATIQNLHVAGSQYVRTRKYMGGLVGKVFGKQSTIENCEVSTALSYGDKDDCGAGGFVGQANANVNFNNCMFNGSFSSQGTGFSGFVGDAPKFPIFSACYMLTTSITVAGGTNSYFVRGNRGKYVLPICYVMPPNSVLWIAEPSWTKVSQEQVASGEVAYNYHFKQNLVGNNKDIVPHFFLDDSKSVRKGVFSLNGKSLFTSYTNPNQLFPLPAGIEKMNANTASTGDLTTEVLQKDNDGYYLINDKYDWDVLSYCYNRGDFNSLATNVRLNADINVNTMVGNANVAYSGTFDGQGHTLTANYNVKDEDRVAPFRTINGATITNLRTAGSISSNKSPGMASGLVGNAMGNASTINNCESAVALTFTGSGDATHGGLLGRAQAPVTFNSSAFTGSMTADNGYCIGGFVGWAENHVDINNCLVAADVKVLPATGNDQGNAAFGRNEGQYTITNSYVVKFDNTNINQGSYIDNTQVKNGAMAYVLQNNQAQNYWGQTIGTDDKPVLTANADKHVYKASFQSNNKELAATYANKGNAFPLPELSGYMPLYDNTPASGDVVIALNQADADGYYTIANRDDWNNFVSLYNGTGNYRLTADITDPVTTMAGTDAIPFSGIFDGQGHTLNIDLSNDQAFTAPFRYVKGATIKNLNVTGSVRQTGNGTSLFHASGLAGRTDGATFERCTSSVALTFNGSGDMHSGGFVGHAVSSTININDCAFTGSLTEQPGKNNASVGGLVGWGETDCKVNIKNSYVDLTLENITGQNNFVRARSGWNTNGSTFENCYYTVPANVTHDWDPEPATKVTAEQIKNGEVAYRLQANHTDGEVWGQKLGTDNKPVLVSNGDSHVYKVGFVLSSQEVARYANANGTVTLPTLADFKDVISKEYDNGQYVSGLVIPDFDGNTKVTEDRTITCQVTSQEIMDIATSDDWEKFAEAVNSGQTHINARLTSNWIHAKDITAGCDVAPYRGTFDGQGYYIGVTIEHSNNEETALFSRIDGATIKNVNTNGFIVTSRKFAGGLVGRALGNSTISHCSSEVTIFFQGEGDATLGGLVGITSGNAKLSNCLFNGSLDLNYGHSVGGLIGWAERPVTIENCLVAGIIDTKASDNAAEGNSALARNNPNVTATNCYVLEFDNLQVRQGNVISEEEMQSGLAANRLQDGQSELIWGQIIGGRAVPHFSSDPSEQVFRVDFNNAADEKVVSRYTNSGKTVTLPTYKELIAKVDKYNYYKVKFGNDFTADTKVESNMTVPVTYEAINDFKISTVADWDEFAKAVADGQNYLNASIADNIDGVTTMVGTKEYPYAGRVFNYDDYVVTVNYDFSNTDTLVVAPFRYVDGAVVHHFHSAGTIKTNGNAGNTVGGIFGEAVGKSTIESSMSTVDIVRTGEGEAYTGGIVGHLNAGCKVTFNNVGFAGSVKGENGNVYGGLVGWIDQGNPNGTAEISNCYTAGNIDVPAAAEGQKGSTPFVGCNSSDQYTLENCYYLPFDNMQATELGTAVTDEQLKSGEVTFKLQRPQGESSWSQLIGTDEVPQIFDGRPGKSICETVYDDDTKAYDNYLVLDENKSILKSLEDNLSYGSGVKLKRTFLEGWNTLILPFYMSTEDVEEAFGEDTKVAYFTNDRPNYIALNTKEDTKEIMAYEAVLIKPSKPLSELTTVLIPNGFFDSPYNGVQIPGDNGINFVGSFDASYILQDGEYFINGMKLWRSNGNTTIKGTRAYITVPEDAAGAKIGLIIDGEEVTTGISSVTIDGVEYGGNSAVYTLAGQKVANSLGEERNLKAGVYIVNGKKVVIK